MTSEIIQPQRILLVSGDGYEFNIDIVFLPFKYISFFSTFPI